MFRPVESNKVFENELRSIRKCDVGHDSGGDGGKRCVCVFIYFIYIYIYIYIDALQFLALCHLPSRWNISMTT